MDLRAEGKYIATGLLMVLKVEEKWIYRTQIPPNTLLHDKKGSYLYTETIVAFFLNNQQDALIIQFFYYKTLNVLGILSAHHQEFSTVHSALVSFMQVFDDRFQVDSGWNCSFSLTLLGSGHQKPA